MAERTESSAAGREEARLQDQTKRLGALIASTSDWIWEVDAQGHYTYVSERVRDVLGYEPAWLLGKTPFDIMPSAEAQDVARLFADLVGKRAPFRDLENLCLHADGGTRVMSTSGVPILDDDGALLGYLGADRDITEVRRASERIQEGEARLRAIFDNANVGIMLLTGYRMLEAANVRLAEIFGYDSPEQMYGISMLELHLSEARFREFGEKYYEPLRQREQIHVEYQLKRRNGRAVWCLLSGAALDEAKPADLSRGVIWTVDDITRRKAKEAQLEWANRDLAEEHALFTTGPTMVFRWGPEAGYPVRYCSANTGELLGVTADELVSGRQAFMDLVHPDDRGRVAGAMEQAATQGEERLEIEYRLGDARGGWRYFIAVINLRRGPGGALLVYHGYLVDITERRRKQAELRMLIDAIPDLIFFKDATGCYVDCNEAFTQFIGRDRTEIVGFDDFAFFDREVAEFFRGQDRMMLESGEARRNEEWVDYPDGRRYLLDTLKLPYKTRDGDTLGVLGISRDITRQRERENDLERAERLAGMGSGYLDLRTGESVWSDNLFALLGLDPAVDRPGIETLLSRVKPSHRDELERTWRDLVDREVELWEGEFPVELPGGGERWIRSQRTLVRDQKGQPLRVDGVALDVSAQRRAQQALRDSEARYRSIFESGRQPMLLLGVDGTLNQVNPAACDFLGYPEQAALIGAQPQSLSPPVQPDGEDSVDKGERLIAEAFSQGYRRFEWVHRHRDGHELPVEVTLSRVQLRDEYGLLATWYDLSDRRRAEALEERGRAVFDNTAEGIIITDADNRIQAVNPAFTAITGYTPEEVLGKPPKLLQSGKQGREFYGAMWAAIKRSGRWSGEIWNRRKNGELYVEWLSISTIRDERGRIEQHIGVFGDITQTRRSEEEIEHLTHYDLVTGLPNAVLMRARLEQLFSEAGSDRKVAAFCVNLDGFRRVVSRYGHERTDAVLKAVADTVLVPKPERANATRLGADSFLVAMAVRDQEAVLGEARRIQRRMLSALRVEGVGPLSLSCCVGIALYPSDAGTPGALIGNAEVALQAAKNQGPGSLAYYQAHMTEEAARRLETEQALRGALEDDQFELFFQPKVDLAAAAIHSAEALIRWRRPDGTLALPAEFLPVIDATDMVDALGEWVVRRAVETLARWRDRGLPPIQLSINASGVTVTSGHLADFIGRALREQGVAAERLQVELLENVLIDDPEQAGRELKRLHDMGVSIALDDFGTGYSSLGYLKRFPFDALKIDQAFVRDLTDDAGDRAIVHSTVSMAHNLGLEAIAEGVETDAQLSHLMALGCDSVQGFRFGKPMPEAAFVAELERPGSGLIPRELREWITRGVLVAESDPGMRADLKTLLTRLGWYVFPASSTDEALALLAEKPVKVVIAGHAPP
ncbi:MAG: PAS domain S-box protein, partial [Gammaproteobacteria bacterium]